MNKFKLEIMLVIVIKINNEKKNSDPSGGPVDISAKEPICPEMALRTGLPYFT